MIITEKAYRCVNCCDNCCKGQDIPPDTLYLTICPGGNCPGGLASSVACISTTSSWQWTAGGTGNPRIDYLVSCTGPTQIIYPQITIGGIIYSNSGGPISFHCGATYMGQCPMFGAYVLNNLGFHATPGYIFCYVQPGSAVSTNCCPYNYPDILHVTFTGTTPSGAGWPATPFTMPIKRFFPSGGSWNANVPGTADSVTFQWHPNNNFPLSGCGLINYSFSVGSLGPANLAGETCSPLDCTYTYTSGLTAEVTI